METLLRRAENRYMLKAVEAYAKEKFKTHYGNTIDSRLLNPRCRRIEISYQGNLIYIYSTYKRGNKCGQTYNIYNIFYEMVEKKYRPAVIFDCAHRINKEDIINVPNKIEYIRNILIEDYNIKVSSIIDYIARDILEKIIDK
ncbi:MAG: hypothetical protein IKT40_12295 [Bacilli bacterium]|nr:hypothetical protein [Bacilli bacterium]